MPYTVTQLITKFRDLSGENSLNPSATDVLKYLNLARNSDESPYLELIPKLSGELGTLAATQSIDLVAGTSAYAITTMPENIIKVFLKWSASEQYRPVDNVTSQAIYENSPEAISSNSAKPAIGVANGNLYIYPEPSSSVTAGVLLHQLKLPADMISTDTIVESNRVALIMVKKAISLYYRSMKRFDESKAWEEYANAAIQKAINNSPGNMPEIRISLGRGNISRRLGSR
jgi:hypothetical protein